MREIRPRDLPAVTARKTISPHADGVTVIDSSPAMTMGRRHAVKSFSIRIGEDGRRSSTNDHRRRFLERAAELSRRSAFDDGKDRIVRRRPP
jgi:hypothetical protein